MCIVIWEFVPALHVLQHVIYFEWLVCVAVFLAVAVLDKEKIKEVELRSDEQE